jgi:perosamine synthetase
VSIISSSPLILAENVLAAIRRITGPGIIALHEPSFTGNEWLYLKECLDSTFVSSVGKFVDRFEHELADFVGVKRAIAVVNGTAALHIALKLAGVVTNDEVLVPALTFVSTANAVTYCGASPHFVDSDENTLGMNVSKLRNYLTQHTEQRLGACINRQTGRTLRAMIPMHTFGHPSDLDGLLAVARDFNIIIVEDAAESLGSYYQGRHTGTFGQTGVISFNGNKTITTGGGGAILTNNQELADHAKHLTTTAKLPHAWEFKHDEIGFNYRMPNLNAALGCAQLEQLPGLLTAKRNLFRRYQEAFVGLQGVQLITEPKSCKSNYWLQCLALDNESVEVRDTLLRVTNEAGIMTRPLWTLLCELSPFKHCPSMNLEVARSLSRRLINIPSSAKLGQAQS